MDQLDPSRIRAALTTRVFGRELRYLPRTGSTNDVARDLALRGATEGTVVLADEQVAGRGRKGRRWLAPPGTCLLLSILFRPDLPPTQAQRLTMLCSLATAAAVEQVSGLRVDLKWPNDIIVESKIKSPKSKVQSPKSKVQSPKSKVQSPKSKIQDSGSTTSAVHSRTWRKLAGVLTETGVTGERLDFAIVGIGLNVDVAPETLPSLAPDATSVLAEVGRPVDRVALLAALLCEVERRYEELCRGVSPHREWAARLATLGQLVTVNTSEGALTGVAESVDEGGALLMRTPDGGLHRLLVGDVVLAHSG